jgi:hypothetical protein
MLELCLYIPKLLINNYRYCSHNDIQQKTESKELSCDRSDDETSSKLSSEVGFSFVESPSRIKTFKIPHR